MFARSWSKLTAVPSKFRYPLRSNRISTKLKSQMLDVMHRPLSKRPENSTQIQPCPEHYSQPMQLQEQREGGFLRQHDELTEIITENDNMEHLNSFMDTVVVVNTLDHAKKILSKLECVGENFVWACDTEVSHIDLKVEGPVGNGRVICLSMYGGPDVDVGHGKGKALWIENLDDSFGVLDVFRDWFQSDKYKKVWHNYGFDRHVMNNMKIDCNGFVGDTMHMARLWDTSRDKAAGGGGEGYSLETLSGQFVNDPRFSKTSMKDLFGIPRVKKDGSESKIKELPSMDELQRNPDSRLTWIEYSAKDAVATWHVYDGLKKKLEEKDWVIEDSQGNEVTKGTMFDFYNKYLVDFGNLLTDMERHGIKLNTEAMREAEGRARQEMKKKEELFYSWASRYCDDAKYINVGSTIQIQQLLFGEYGKGDGKRDKPKLINNVRVFKIEKSEDEIALERAEAVARNPYINCTATDLKKILKARQLKTNGTKRELMERVLEDDIRERMAREAAAGSGSHALAQSPSGALDFEGDDSLTDDIMIAQNHDPQSFSEEEKALFRSKLSVYSSTLSADVNASIASLAAATAAAEVKPSKHREITIKSIEIRPEDFTPAGSAQVSTAVLRKLSGKIAEKDEDCKWGTALEFFGNSMKGREACRAIAALADIGQIDTTIGTFLGPLQKLVDHQSRIHCSLNLNTETGRLSSRRPNLQNQPALEKDQYKIRDAFVAEEGNTLIVADYGQLELRLMAHITGCKSMIDAFESGGCFHSRTAVGMYDYIKKAVDDGKVLLEWDYGKGQPTCPLTVHGLAADWGITIDEAQETLEAWYRDRPEVREWQDRTRERAKAMGSVRTLMGRYRDLPDAMKLDMANKAANAHALRAAINAPIQGSAADVVMMAMIKLWKSEKNGPLKELGWKLLLQIHDEVILEGPKETKDAALKEVVQCMENPFDGFGLENIDVHLDVDAKSADTWYKAK